MNGDDHRQILLAGTHVGQGNICMITREGGFSAVIMQMFSVVSPKRL